MNAKYEWNKWEDIDWKAVEVSVFKLQKRIHKASQSGNVKLTHRLQRLLTKSYYGKLWATRRVTQDNQGKVTAGVDGKKSLSPKLRLELVKNLQLSGKAKPLRRVRIPKANGETRGLGIPTIEDRALQSLVKLGLEPQWEAVFEENSYGFRPARSCHDAIQAIFAAIRYKPKFVLIVYQQLKRWAERRHQKKTKRWVADKYWHTDYSNGRMRNWCFSTESGLRLLNHADTLIVRHIKVQSNKSIFDGDLRYWSARMGKHPEMPAQKAKLLKFQRGKCNLCGLYFQPGDLIEKDHIIPTSLGGKNELKNLQLLHKHCHDKKTRTDGSLKRRKKETV